MGTAPDTTERGVRWVARRKIAMNKSLQALLILSAALATTLPGCDDSSTSSGDMDSTPGAAGKSDAAVEPCSADDLAFLREAANAPRESEDAVGPRIDIDLAEWDKAVEEEGFSPLCEADAVFVASEDDADKSVDSYGNICGGCWCDGEVCWDEPGTITCDLDWCSCDYVLNDCI